MSIYSERTNKPTNEKNRTSVLGLGKEESDIQHTDTRDVDTKVIWKCHKKHSRQKGHSDFRKRSKSILYQRHIIYFLDFVTGDVPKRLLFWKREQVAGDLILSTKNVNFSNTYFNFSTGKYFWINKKKKIIFFKFCQLAHFTKNVYCGICLSEAPPHPFIGTSLPLLWVENLFKILVLWFRLICFLHKGKRKGSGFWHTDWSKRIAFCVSVCLSLCVFICLVSVCLVST